MHNEVEGEQVLRASAEVASNADQPSWVSELQASLQAGLDKIQAKKGYSPAQNLRQIGQNWQRNGEDEAGDGRLGEETNRKFESVDVYMRAQKKDIEILEKRTVEVVEWTSEVQDILTTSLEQQIRLQEKLTDLEGMSRRSNIQIWGLKEGLREIRLLII